MSFGAGMGAGTGAGIGTGIAIGIASGQKKAVEQIREHLMRNQITVHDSAGHEVDLESLLNEAVQTKCETDGKWVIAAIVAVLVGVALLGTIVYFVF